MNDLKPIETVYNGYRFRSRLEARWAVFFDAFGIKYEYEKEGYDLGDAGYYLPDFWLPELKMFAEIKGQIPTDQEKHKAIELHRASNHMVVILTGIPSGLYKDDDPDSCVTVDIGTEYVCIDICSTFIKCKKCGSIHYTNGTPCCECDAELNWKVRMGNIDRQSYHNAYIKARQARFEHGERG